MTDCIWIETETTAGPEPGHRRVRPEAALQWLDRVRGGAVVAIGPTVDEPLELARRIRNRNDRATVLVSAAPAEFDEMRRAIRHDPQLSSGVSLVSADGDLAAAVDEALESKAAYGRYRDTLDRAQTEIETAPPVGSRPSPEQYQSLMWSAAPVGALAIVRGSHHIVSANPAATELLERDEIDLIGQPLHEVMATDEVGWDWLATRREGEHIEHVISRTSSDGETSHLALRAVDVESASDDVALVFIWDVTERVTYERLQARVLQAERRAREAAEEASEAREAVLGTVSHDLRNPIQSILMSAQLLKRMIDEETDEKVNELANTIGRSAEYMERLVGDLLDIARIEGKGLPIEPESVAVRELVDDAIDLVVGGAEQGRRIDVAPIDEALTLECDRDRVIQLMQNLLSNALKFAPDDTPVEVAAEARDGTVRLTVSDDGPGIPKDEIPHLFDRFWQSDRNGESRGAGLGLAIVKGIVDAHDGEISVESEPGEGTTFCVDLPRA